MTRIFKPWVLVTIGIVFNISSAVITHYFIDMNNQQIRLLENNINNLDSLIESQWRSKTQVDRKEEFLLSMLNRSDNKEGSFNSEIQNLVIQQLTDLVNQQSITLLNPLESPVKNFKTIITVTSQAKQKIIDSINNTYLRRLELDNQRHPVSEKNALLSTLAIFLQVTGLILVLSRDINA